MTRKLPFLLLVAGCAPGTGAVEVSAWGEDAAIDGLSLSDGWTITFDHLLLSISGATLRDQDSEEALDVQDAPILVDLASASTPRFVTSLSAPAQRHWFEFQLEAPSSESRSPDVDPILAQTMQDQGWTRWVQGQATRGAEILTFDWGFDQELSYTLCEDGRDQTPGIAIPKDGTTSAQITVHMDHLFWDTLGTEEAQMRFDAIAASDQDGDGQITAEELAAVDVISIGYETAGLDLPDLWSFIEHSFAIAPHLNGGGLCRVRSR